MKYLRLMAILLAGCTSAPQKIATDSEGVVLACSIGSTNQGVSGSVVFEVRSPELIGKYKAEVGSTQGEIVLDIQNPLGGSEAVIRSTPKAFGIEFPKSKEKNQAGLKEWNGIPASFLYRLLGGRIPCPEADSFQSFYKYEFRKVDGKNWPEHLEWRANVDATESVRFDFDKPEGESFSPREWSAKVAKAEILLRWRIRKGIK